MSTTAPAGDAALPAVGDWDGPFHGELGRLRDDGERVECHVCGRYFHALAHHVRLAHNLTADEYRALFGLNRLTGLVGPKLAARFRVLSVRLEAYRDVGRATILRLTPAQLSAWASRPRRLETRVKPENREQWGRAIEKMRARQAELRAAGRWVQHHPSPEQSRAWGYKVQASLQARRAADPAFDAAWRRAISEGRGGRKTLHCAVCGGPFEVQPSRAARRKLCGSPECRREAKRRAHAGVPKPPEVIAKLVAARRANRAARLSTRPDGTVEATCCVCGARFSTRLRPTPGRTRRTCGRPCLNELLRRLQSGGTPGAVPADRPAPIDLERGDPS